METDKENRRQGGDIYAAMARIAGEVGPIAKGQKGPTQQGSYKFRGIDDIYDRLNSIMSRNGVFGTPLVESVETDSYEMRGARWTDVRLRIRYRFYAADGSYVDAVVIGEGRDNSDKGANKAMSAAHKYALIQVFCIPVAGSREPDEEAHTRSAQSGTQKTTSSRRGERGESSAPPSMILEAPDDPVSEAPKRRRSFAELVGEFGGLMGTEHKGKPVVDKTALASYRSEVVEWKEKYNEALKDGEPDSARLVADEFAARIKEISVSISPRTVKEPAESNSAKKPTADDIY